MRRGEYLVGTYEPYPTRSHLHLSKFVLIMKLYLSLWKDSRKFRFLFTNPEKYLAGRVEVESEDGEDFHP
jgi:hypothetical protein